MKNKIREEKNLFFFEILVKKRGKLLSNIVFKSIMKLKGEEKMKKHNIFKVILITLALFMVLTWIFPSAIFQSAYDEQGRIQMGIFDIFTYQNTSLSYFGQISLFVLLIGGFYGLLNKTGAYRRMLDSLAKKFKGKEWLALTIIMILFAVLTSVCGLQMGLLIFFPFVISLTLLMGYSKLAAISVTVGSTLVGLMGTTFATTTTNVLVQYLSLEVLDGIWAKVIILVVGLILLILNVLKFGKKQNVKEEKDKDDFLPAAVKSTAKGKTKKIWPLVVVFDVILLIMILSFISWNGAFGLTIFDEATNAVTGFKLFGFPIFGKLLGTTLNSFGYWSIGELGTVLLVAIIALKFIYKIKWDDAIDGFVEGAKKALLPAVIIILIYSGLVITTYHPFQLVIYKAILEITKGFNVFTAGIVALLAGLFNVEPSYAFQSVIPYLASIVTDTKLYPLIATMFQSLYGVVMLVVPTSVLLMISLAYLKVSYKDWIQYSWKLFLELIVVLFIVFTVLMLI